MKITTDIIFTFLIFVFIVFIFTSSEYSNAKEISSFIVVGQKFSDIKNNFNTNYIITKSAGERITYSFLGEHKNLTQFATKNDIIEVVEIYNVYDNQEKSIKLYTDLCIMMTTTEKYNLLRAYNTTIEFIKGDVVVRIEQLPTIYGWLVKFTAYLQ